MPLSTLPVLGYNTHLFGDSVPERLLELLRSLGIPVPILNYQDRERRDDIIARLSKGKYAIVGLSEVWDDVYAFRFIAALKKVYPYSFRPHPDVSFPRLLGSGLLILCQFPLRGKEFFEYTDLVGFDQFSHKGIAFARATVEVSGASVDLLLFLTHTQAGEGDQDRQARLSNLKQLRAKIEEIQGVNPGVPSLLIGDLNVIAETKEGQPTPEYQQMLGLFATVGLGDVYRRLHPDPASDPGFTYDGVTNNLVPIFAPEDADAEQRIDFQFGATQQAVDPVTSAVVRDFTYDDDGVTRDLSDHYPLAGDYETSSLKRTEKGEGRRANPGAGR